ncbi:MAG: DHHA1 domain-containing protein, partial [Syntrophobacteraceae bacterium]
MRRDCLTQWSVSSRRIPSSVSEVMDILLQNRNLSPESISGELGQLGDYLSMRGMDEGARIMAGHMAAGHKIVLVCDYDCDGITSAAQVALFLTEIGYVNFQTIIPLREEGYGVPERAIREHPDASLFVAMDCGTLDIKPVEMARATGADCIVIDHHEVSGCTTAPASAIINPKHPECCSSFKEFCSSGLTLLFLAALRRFLRPLYPTVPSLGGKYLALAAIGTIADLVPLVSANRILARSGLQRLNTTDWPPISLLAGTAGLAGKTLTAGHISYYIGPRINAAGRISDARVAYELLIATCPEKIKGLAQDLNLLSGQRQVEQERMFAGIREKLAGSPPLNRTLVVGDPTWPVGVVGIAASRVQQELHYAPVVILSIDEREGIARGSARSIPGFDIHLALRQCSDLLVRWGGHKAAAGLTIRSEKIESFAARFEQIAQRYPAEVFIPSGRVDMDLPLELVNPELVDALHRLEPYGMGNPSP